LARHLRIEGVVHTASRRSHAYRSERLCWLGPSNGWCGQGAPSTNVAMPPLQGHWVL
jgi:hypothetical protein